MQAMELHRPKNVSSATMRASQIKRGDIYYANLNPVIGSEQGDTRPVLIVQNDIGNAYSPTTVAIPLTRKIEKNRLPTHVLIPRSCGLDANSLALMEQIRTIDRLRLGTYVGRIGAKKQAEVDKALSVCVGLVKKSALLELCLCPRCESDFQNSGYVVVKRGWQEYKDGCDLCRIGRGWNFAVFRTEGRNGSNRGCV